MWNVPLWLGLTSEGPIHVLSVSNMSDQYLPLFLVERINNTVVPHPNPVDMRVPLYRFQNGGIRIRGQFFKTGDYPCCDASWKVEKRFSCGSMKDEVPTQAPS
jgi:hypothetical protein